MRVSRTVDGTLRALVRLAARDSGAYASASRLAAELGLSARVLEQQFSLLSTKGLLVSRRGQGGGHALARPASETPVSSVIAALQHRILDAPDVSGDAVSALWSELESELERTLEEMTIESLVTEQKDLDSLGADSYDI